MEDLRLPAGYEITTRLDSSANRTYRWIREDGKTGAEHYKPIHAVYGAIHDARSVEISDWWDYCENQLVLTVRAGSSKVEKYIPAADLLKQRDGVEKMTIGALRQALQDLAGLKSVFEGAKDDILYYLKDEDKLKEYIKRSS